MQKKAFYVPDQPWILDDARVRSDGVIVSELYGLTLEEIQTRFAGAILINRDIALATIKAVCHSVPRPIAALDFYYAKNAMANEGLVATGVTESFKMIDRAADSTTTIYARIHRTYWKFVDESGLSHDEIVDRIGARLDYRSVAPDTLNEAMTCFC